VSDVWGGAGWWLASDGKWYPPSQRPSDLPSTRNLSVSGFDDPGQVVTDPRPQSFPGSFNDDLTIGQSPVTDDPKKRRRLIPIVAIVVAVVAASVTAAVSFSGASQTGWSDGSLDVVGSPVAANGVVVLLNVTSRHQLELSAVNPSNGSTIWSHPFSVSGITPGVAFGPTVLDGTVLDLAPAQSSSDPTVTIKGVNVTTGRVRWSDPDAILSDAPAVCPGDQEFCVAAFDSDTTNVLVGIDPGTGRLDGAIRGPIRNMAVPQPGSTTEGGLWQTDASSPTLMQVSADGRAAWTRTVASLFGGNQYDPNYGWDFLIKGDLDVGSIANAPVGNVLPLDNFKTLGISEADGTVKWSASGYYDCGGGLQFLTSNVVCLFSGSARESGTSVTMSGVAVTLRGLDIASGATTWSLPVLNAQALSLGTNVAFADGTHLVVRLRSGRQVVLDTESGKTAPIGANQVFWCEQNPMYPIKTATGSSVDGKRQGAPVFKVCSASGSTANGVPAAGPSTVGLHLDGMFVWASPNGLRAAPLPG
jgi:outer membrane protein assembly factor BamB